MYLIGSVIIQKISEIISIKYIILKNYLGIPCQSWIEYR